MSAESILLDAVFSGRLPSSIVLIALAVYVVIKIRPELQDIRNEIRAQADRVIEELRDRRLSDVERAVREATGSEPERDPPPTRTRTGRHPATKG